MKATIKVYIVLLAISYTYMITNSITQGLWSQPETWLQWIVNLMGIFALICYAYSLESLIYVRTQKKWMIILVVMLGFYYYQFSSPDFFYPDMDEDIKISILLSHLLWVCPSVICTAYLAFRHIDSQQLP